MFFIDDEEFTKYGYYNVDGFKTLSKLEAWQLSKGDFNKIKFIYNDDHFSKIDWSVEPKEDIYELFRQRAQQLREKYDYIVLIYSGGVDSHTILETFLKNNIQIFYLKPYIFYKPTSKNESGSPQSIGFVYLEHSQ